MLVELQVTDLALVAGARVGFGPGLNLLTGETGSGKSLIVDALGLSLGARAALDQIRHGARRALVEAVFDVSEVASCAGVLNDLGHELGSPLILTREVARSGQARINGRPATPTQLRRLGVTLVGIHGQHEQHGLLDGEAQTLLLDTFGQALPQREGVARTHREWSAARARLADLERMRARGRREEEYMRWQLEELDTAELRVGEDEALAQERSVARHAVRLGELTAGAMEALGGEQGLAEAAHRVGVAADVDPGLSALRDRLDGLHEGALEAISELRRYGEQLETDPGRLEAIEGRLAQLDAIKRKYGGGLAEAVEERDRLRAQLGQAENLEESIVVAVAEVDGAQAQLAAAAAQLTAVRTEAGQRLGRAVTLELGGLRLEQARLEVRLEPRAELAAEGAEVAAMMFSANPGEPLAPLAKVASGGELSRVMLAVKTVGAEADLLPTLIFDEVDAGIGGEAALQVGLRLQALGRRRQVLVVTHLPQIACFAEHHLVVTKSAGPDGRNLVLVRELETDQERAEELARMMSGSVTPKALARAHELIDEARGR